MAEDLRIRQAIRNHKNMGDSKRKAITATAENFEDVDLDHIEEIADEIYNEKKVQEKAKKAKSRARGIGDKVTGGKISEWQGKRQANKEKERIKNMAERETGWPENSQKALNKHEEWTEKGKRRKKEMKKKEAERKADSMLPGPSAHKVISSTEEEEEKAKFREKQRKEKIEKAKWECSNCGHKNPGLSNKCEICGTSRENSEELKEEAQKTSKKGGSDEGKKVSGKCPICDSTDIKRVGNHYECSNDHYIEPENLLPEEEKAEAVESIISRNGVVFAIVTSFLSMIPMFIFAFSWKWLFLWLAVTFFGMEHIFR